MPSLPTTPEIPTSQLRGEEANCFQGKDCSLEEGGSDSMTLASEQLAKSSSLGAGWGQGNMLVRSSPLLGAGTSSFPGGNTMLGFTHIHRLGSISGPVQRKIVFHSSLNFGYPDQATRPPMSEDSFPTTHHLHQVWVFSLQVFLVAQLYRAYIWQLAKRKTKESQNILGFPMRCQETGSWSFSGIGLWTLPGKLWHHIALVFSCTTSLTFSFTSAFFFSHAIYTLPEQSDQYLWLQSPSINLRFSELYL